MGCARYAWPEVCVSALRESDPKKLIACIDYAITAIERRHAEWESNPGTPDELRDIRKTISHLESLLKEKLLTNGAVDVRRSAAKTSDPAEERIAAEFDGQIKQLPLSLRSTPLYGKQIIRKSKR
jgi:hypothetical protein